LRGGKTASFIGIFVIPPLYVLFQSLRKRFPAAAGPPQPAATTDASERPSAHVAPQATAPPPAK
jgi:hypothetical protein